LAQDVYYEFYAGGKTATSQAVTSGLLFGDYTGFSNLNNDAVVHIQVSSSVVDLRIFGAGPDDPQYDESGSGGGTVIPVGTSNNILLFPQRVGNASLLGYTQQGTAASDGASTTWAIWRLIR